MKVEICGVMHDVVYQNKQHDNNMGRWVEKACIIEIDESMNKQVQSHTLWHEFFHAVLHMQGDSELGNSEDFVNRLATSMINSSVAMLNAE